MKIDYSIVLPTRNNIDGLKSMVSSFLNKAKNPSRVEFVIGPDINDPQLNDIKKAMQYLPVRIYETHPTDNFNRDYFNWLTWKSVGRNVWCMNDDVVMETQDWDSIINEKTVDRSIYLVDTWDSTHEHEGVSFPRFPLISRKAVDTVGFLMYPQVRTYPADRVIYELYKLVGAIIECHEVKLTHNHIENNSDPSKSRMYRIYREDCQNGVFPVNAFIQNYQLKKAMNKEFKDGNEDLQVL